MMENRPVAAYTLALVGAAIQIVALFIAVLAAPLRILNYSSQGLWGGMMGMEMVASMFYYGTLGGYVWMIAAAIIVGIGVYGAVAMKSANLARVRMSSTLVLVASIIAFPTLWGFLIGSLLMFTGSLLGLTWVPPHTQTPQ